MDLADASASVSRPGLLRYLLPCLIHRLGGRPSGGARFEVSQQIAIGKPKSTGIMEITWNCDRLLHLNAHLQEDVELIRQRRSPLLEKATEFAGLALAVCAVHEYLPGRRVQSLNSGRAPDMYLSLAEDAGIEVAGRNSGLSAYRRAIQVKIGDMEQRDDLVEAYVSIWGLDVTLGCKRRIR